jgi:multisubunit Na+/H+ antiporter MnhB subunit
MRKLIKHPNYTLFGILALIITQSSALAGNGKEPDGALTSLQIGGGVFILLLVIMIALIKGEKSTDISIPS